MATSVSIFPIGALPPVAAGGVWALVAAILGCTVGAVLAGEPHYTRWPQEPFPTCGSSPCTPSCTWRSGDQ